MGYLNEIGRDYLKVIKEMQKLKSDPENMGEFSEDTEGFFRDIYRNFLEEHPSRKTFLVAQNYEKQFKCMSIETFIKKSKNFSSFTPAVYWHHKLRTKETAILNGCITLDIDQKKDGSGRDYSPRELAQVMHNEFGYYPNYVWESCKTKGNMQANYVINPVAASPQAVFKFEAIAKRLAILLGADVSAVNFNNLYQVPKLGVWKFSDQVLDLGDFEFVFDDEELNQALEYKQAAKVCSFTEKQILSAPAIKALLEAEFLYYRNHAAFTIGLLYYALGKDQDEAEELLLGEWFDKVNDGRFPSRKGRFKKREVRSTLKSAYSGRYNGPTKEWITRLTGIDFPYNIYKWTYIKKEDGYMSKNELRTKLIDWIRENDGITIKQDDLVKILGVAKRSLIRQIQALKDEGVIDFTTSRGRHSNGTTFHYTYQNTAGFGVVEDHNYTLKGLELHPEDEKMLDEMG